MSIPTRVLGLILVATLLVAACAGTLSDIDSAFDDGSSETTPTDGDSIEPSSSAETAAANTAIDGSEQLVEGDGEVDDEVDDFNLEPEDEECRGYDGEPVDSCTTPSDLTMSTCPDCRAEFGEDVKLVVEFPLDSPDVEVTLEIVSDDSGKLIVVDCSEDQGCTTFYGPGFETVDGPYAIDYFGTDRSGGTFAFSEVPLSVSAEGELLIDLPGGTTPSGAEMLSGPRLVTGVTIYTDETSGEPMDRLKGVSNYSTSAIASALT